MKERKIMICKNEIKLEKHFGSMVWTNTATDKERKTECLCLNCSVRPCEIAKKLYDICVNYDTAMMMTRCKNFKKQLTD